jgi:hypothetical protein
MRKLVPATLVACALAYAAPAQAAHRPITGSLGAKGYTLIALAPDGRATSVRVKGSFRLVPPASRVTLHLRGPKGVYAGPVVVASSGMRAIVGVRAGAKLGSLRVGRGVARPARALARRWLDASAWATTRRGVPRGAGRLGLVRGPAIGRAGTGRDQDRDGIPGAFDVDDNGNLVLDNNDRAGRGRARIAQAPSNPNEFHIFSNFHFNLDETLNANAGGVTDAQIDDAMTRAGSFVGLVFEVPPGTVQLDCGKLVYCSPGGSGRASEPFPDGQPFPGCCDPDGNGWGTITAGPTHDFQLRTLAPASRIGSGDTFIEHVSGPDGERELTGVLNYMFNTTPAAKAWSDSAGDSGTFAYAVPSGAPGTLNNPLALHRDADGKVKMTFTFWRPQRKAIPGAGEGEGFVDVGGLEYQVNMPNAPSGATPAAVPPGPLMRGAGSCPLATLSSSGPQLRPTPPFSMTTRRVTVPPTPPTR